MSGHKYTLSLTKEYVSHWGVSEACRELIQNVIDNPKPYEYNFDEYLPGLFKFTLTSKDTWLHPSTLLLGTSSKKEDGYIGHFGEGYKLALLVLTRLGKAVTVINGVPEVPVGWTDHPSGVTKDVPYEYCSCVTSNKGKWGTMWSEPFVWSHFGQNGMDGDGVEYIYYVALIAPTNNLPESWTNDEGFQNNEYIKYGSGWTDNP